MIESPLLRIDHLSLTNFRCFAKCELDFHPELTVLVAENGKGKTAILDALRIALGPLIVGLLHTFKDIDLMRSDVRIVYGESGTMTEILPTSIKATGMVRGQTLDWERALLNLGPKPRSTTKDSELLRLAGQRISDDVKQIDGGSHKDSATLPLIAYYGTDRLWHDERTSTRAFPSQEVRRRDGYYYCLSSAATNALAWYEQMMVVAGTPQFSSLQSEILLAAVEKAMRIVLKPTGWHKLGWDYENRQLLVEHQNQTRLPFWSLSDGVRTMVALVIDLARRCATLNPHFKDDAAQQTPGLVMIDEVDMHLHPRWQQLVVGLLRDAFPKVQLVLTTHSPQVLSTVDKESIRIINLVNGQGDLQTPSLQTRGVESADVLAKIMNVDPIPQVVESQWLTAYRVMVQTDEYETNEGIQLWSKIVDHFGGDHPVIDELQTLQRLQVFKRLHGLENNKDS